MGPLQLYFIKESWNVKGEDDPGNHIFKFINEVCTTAKNHIVALGGNVLLSFKLQGQESGGRAYKNQTYNMFTLTGDVALVLYGNSDIDSLNKGTISNAMIYTMENELNNHS